MLRQAVLSCPSVFPLVISISIRVWIIAVVVHCTTFY